MRLMLAIVLCISAGSASAQQTDYDSGNHMLAHCKTGLDGSSGNINVWVGQCSGAISALMFMSPVLNSSERFCPPNGYSILQARRVAVRYMEQHPEALHINY